MGYYQGMNYIAVFIYYLFKDVGKSYVFLGYIVDRFLASRFGNSLIGLMELLFLSDKLIQKDSGMFWRKLNRNKVFSIHFSIPCYMTVFTTNLKAHDPLIKNMVLELWDVFLAEGFINVLKFMMFLLNEQKDMIYSLNDEAVLMSLKNIETHPFNVLKVNSVSPQIIEMKTRKFSKQDILKVSFEKGFFSKL